MRLSIETRCTEARDVRDGWEADPEWLSDCVLGFGVVLIADGFGVHVPKGYTSTAMAFSAAVEGLNIWSRKCREAATAKRGEPSGTH